MDFILSKITVGIAFLLLIWVLFDDEKDYLLYSFTLLIISGIITSFEIEEAMHLENYIEAIDWEVILFLFSIFIIVAILNAAKVFHHIAKLIVNKFKNRIRAFFYVICITSTLSAAIIEDLSVAIIFIPIIIIATKELEVNPAPFLYGMTICINLASTLTPFGSAENIIIAHHFDLDTVFFLKNFGLYFLITMVITLVGIDLLVLNKSIKTQWQAACMDGDGKKDPSEEEEMDLSDFDIDPKVFKKNLVGLGIFIAMQLFLPYIHLAGLIGVIVFAFLNSELIKDKKDPTKTKRIANLAKYMRQVDNKLIYFFIVLFLMVYLMELNGTVLLLERAIESNLHQNIFYLAVGILIITSLFSGFLDNAPVTVMFLPILDIILKSDIFVDLSPEEVRIPLIVAFVLGINLGGNFLPQGSAADMMTLELSRKHCVYDMNYKRLTKIGGLFALIHVLLGIGYLFWITH